MFRNIMLDFIAKMPNNEDEVGDSGFNKGIHDMTQNRLSGHRNQTLGLCCGMGFQPASDAGYRDDGFHIAMHKVTTRRDFPLFPIAHTIPFVYFPAQVRLQHALFREPPKPRLNGPVWDKSLFRRQEYVHRSANR